MADAKYKANIALTLVSAGFFASYPFRHTFAGGLIASACEASMVGGLADWFAVTALFRRPLGIPFRTALVPRNRDKIFQAITDMVEDELLTAEHVGQALGNYDLAAVIVRYLEDHGGREDMRKIAGQLTEDIINKINEVELARAAELLVKQQAADIELTPLVADGADWLLANGYDELLIHWLIDECCLLVKQEQAPEFIGSLLVEAQHAYERGMVRRKLFHRALEKMVNLSPLHIGKVAQRQLLVMLDQLKDPSNPLRERLALWLRSMVRELRTNQDWQGRLEKWKLEQLDELHLRTDIADYIAHFRAARIDKINFWKQLAQGRVDESVDKFKDDEVMRTKADNYIKAIIVGWLTGHHSEIGRIVKAELNRLSEDELVKFIESKTGDDLQMIRINGSVVGGIVGVFLYMLNLVIG